MKKVYLLFAIGLLALLLVFRSLNSQKTLQSRGSEEPRKAIFATLTYSDTNTPISIKQVYVADGAAPAQIPGNISNYVAEIHDASDVVLFRQQLLSDNRLEVFTDPRKTHTIVEQKKPEKLFVLPYNTGAKSLVIKDKTGHELARENITISQGNSLLPVDRSNIKVKSATGSDFLQRGASAFQDYTPPSSSSLTSNNNGFVDVVFVSANYGAGDMQTFRDDTAHFTQTFLSYEPYQSRAAQFKFYNLETTDDLGCTFDQITARLLVCNSAKVKAAVAAAGIPAELYAVIYNSPTYGGSGGDIIAVSTSRGGLYFNQTPLVLVHESGHTLGLLADEYVDTAFYPDTVGNTIQDGLFRYNCFKGNTPVPDWQQIDPNVQYFKGCSYSQFWRSTDTSIMKDVFGPGLKFNTISEHYLNLQIDAIAGYSRPPTITNMPISPNPISSSPAPSLSINPDTGRCPTKNQGDANCNGKPDLVDYEIWRREYIGDGTNSCSLQNLTTAACQDDADHDGNIMDADFNGDGKVSLADYQIWRDSYLKLQGISPTNQPGNTPTNTVAPTRGSGDPALKIIVGTANHGSVVMENSVMKVTYQYDNSGGVGDFMITEWVDKLANNRDITKQISAPKPGNQPGKDYINNENCEDYATGGKTSVSKNLLTGTVTYDGTDKKTVRITQDVCNIVEDWTIYPNSPVMKIDYISYTYDTIDNRNSRNVVSPTDPTKAVAEPMDVILYGIDTWRQTNDFLCTGQETTFCQKPVYDRLGIDGRNDPPDGGPLSYKGNFIFGFAEKATGIGYGRVMPVANLPTFWIHINESWEMLYYPFSGITSRGPPFTGYMYMINGGPTDGLSIGQSAVDGTIVTR